MTVTRSELQAWLDTWNENHAAPSADSVVDFLGIELAPEPMFPVGQRRRSPDGVEVIKTDDGTTDPWRRYRGPGPAWRSDVEVADPGPAWFTDNEVADWEVITDAPEVPEDIIAAVTCLITETGESLQGSRGIARRMADAGLLVGTLPEAPKCDREHLPSHSVRICLATLSDEFITELAKGAGSPSGPIADAAHRERERRRRGEGHASVTTVWSTELDLSPDAN